MNYDVTISKEVSLSRILDQMILDGSDFPLIVSFLASHEDKIREIYRGSAFVFDLYDLMAHPGRVDAFLADHIMDLPEWDCGFAIQMWRTHFKSLPGGFAQAPTSLLDCAWNSPSMNALRYLENIGWSGIAEDEDIEAGDIDPIKLVNSLVRDERDMNVFICQSMYARSILMADTFISLDPTAQYMILSCIAKNVTSRYLGRFSAVNCISHMANSLLVQLMALDEPSTVDWCLGVLGHCSVGRMRNNTSLQQDMLGLLPAAITDKLHSNEPFEDIVFDMNLMGSQLDPMILFAYMYIYGSRSLRESMTENKDLVEFFNLPFEWTDLELFNGKAGA